MTLTSVFRFSVLATAATTAALSPVCHATTVLPLEAGPLHSAWLVPADKSRSEVHLLLLAGERDNQGEHGPRTLDPNGHYLLAIGHNLTISTD